MEKTIEVLRQEIHRLQMQQAECVTKYGYIRSNSRYEYNQLMKEIKSFDTAIKQIEALFPIEQKGEK